MKYAFAVLAATLFAGSATATRAPPTSRSGEEFDGRRDRVGDLTDAARGAAATAGEGPRLANTASTSTKGRLLKADFTSASAHVHGKPTLVHGLLNPDANEAGDLPNLYVAADGTGNAEVFSTSVALKAAAGREHLADNDGSAIVIHANADDHKAQPIGGAGARIACGVIAGG